MKKLLINCRLRFTGNFGILGWMDFIHGTDKSFSDSESFKKHKFLIPFMTKQVTDDYEVEKPKSD
jgi:hypothetical protein